MNKILIIEDDTTISSIISDILSNMALVEVAHNYKKAIKLIKDNDFDLVITDYFLGDHNGLEVVKELQNESGEVPVILISAYPTVDILTEGIESKIISFFRKPINFDQLIAKVESILFFESKYTIGDKYIHIKNSHLTLMVDGETYQLTEVQFKLMRFFLDNRDKIVEREKIISSIWGGKKLASENILDTHLLNLKKRVPFLVEHLKTLPRIGYIFTTDKR